jgi:PTH2 family peptidyl-tRNA hydrolase
MADVRAPPTPLAMIIGTAMIAGVSGYMIGIASSLGLIPNPFVAKEARRRGVDNYDDEEESEEEDIDESILDHAPNWANGVEADKRDGLRATAAGKAEAKKEVVKTPWEDNKYEECKLVLVVRTDLGMTKGVCSSLFLSFSC